LSKQIELVNTEVRELIKSVADLKTEVRDLRSALTTSNHSQVAMCSKGHFPTTTPSRETVEHFASPTSIDNAQAGPSLSQYTVEPFNAPQVFPAAGEQAQAEITPVNSDTPNQVVPVPSSNLLKPSSALVAPQPASDKLSTSLSSSQRAPKVSKLATPRDVLPQISRPVAMEADGPKRGLSGAQPEPSSSTGCPENLWVKFHEYCRAEKVKFDNTVVNTGNDTKPEWVAVIQLGDMSWTSSQPERTKFLAKENVIKLLLNDWATEPRLFNAPFPPFGASVIGTHPASKSVTVSENEISKGHLPPVTPSTGTFEHFASPILIDKAQARPSHSQHTVEPVNAPQVIPIARSQPQAEITPVNSDAPNPVVPVPSFNPLKPSSALVSPKPASDQTYTSASRSQNTPKVSKVAAPRDVLPPVSRPVPLDADGPKRGLSGAQLKLSSLMRLGSDRGALDKGRRLKGGQVGGGWWSSRGAKTGQEGK
ncbi:hypothetical protein FS837_003830, partial [Tulasnella sp. UAMH 9824]